MNTNSSQTSKTWLETATVQLEKAGILTARLDCLVLLEDVTGKDRSLLLGHPEYVLKGLALKKLNHSLERRISHEPLAYIRGKAEFYGREFIVSRDTLQPRPESETMIVLLEQLRDNLTLVIDVGTGSGCLGVTAKLELPETRVVATDISSQCLKIAQKNAIKWDTDIQFFHGDLLQPIRAAELKSQQALILANLPYVPDNQTVNEAAMFEPKQAIFGGNDGLDLYRRLFEQSKLLVGLPEYILTESMPFQHENLARIARTNGYKLLKTEDFIQVFKKINS